MVSATHPAGQPQPLPAHSLVAPRGSTLSVALLFKAAQPGKTWEKSLFPTREPY